MKYLVCGISNLQCLQVFLEMALMIKKEGSKDMVFI